MYDSDICVEIMPVCKINNSGIVTVTHSNSVKILVCKPKNLSICKIMMIAPTT